MNREQIIQMAREAGIEDWWDSGNEHREVLQKHLEAFAKLVAEHERESCAALCFQMWEKWMDADPSERGNLPRDAEDCAAAIRARGQA